MKTGTIIQVRMGSTRFPGKVLKPLPDDRKNAPRAMEWTMRACLATGFPVYVATSTNKEDDAIDEFVTEWCCSHLSSPIVLFRGDPIDVLDRLYQCAKLHGLTEIIRITGDCPFVDPDVIRQVVELRRMEGADYASNVDPPTWPDGLDCQVVTFAALEEAWREATDPTDRDTVLQYIVHRRHIFNVVNLPCPLPGLAMHRWVLDTEDDYAVLSRMAKALINDGKVGVPRLVDVLSVSPGPIWPEGARNERYLAARTYELGASRPEPFVNSSVFRAAAKKVQPYGASTYSKSYVAWGGEAPLYLTHAQGSRVWDVDGNEMIDMTAALGTTILGHADPGVRAAIERQLDNGIAFPLAHCLEGEVAGIIADRVMPNGKVVFGKNGSDVTTAAVRVARVVTGREQIAIASGGYHGWHDWALSLTERGEGCYAGTGYYGDPRCAFLRTKNLIEGLKSTTVAAVIVEPDKLTASELGDLIETAHRSEALVIFDEMVTAFRYPFGTLAVWDRVNPDLVCLGKALGNGMPITALVGKPEIMDRFVSSDKNQPYAFYSGTHFGETLSLAAAGHVVNRMDSFNQGRLCEMASRISEMLSRAAADLLDKNHPFWIARGHLPKIGFSNQIDGARFRREMAMNGVLIYSLFLPTLAHSDADLTHVEDALRSSLKAISAGTASGGDDLKSSLIMRS